MKVIVGLGNPGHEYELTRHNAGFRVVDEVARHDSGSTTVGLFGITHGAQWKGEKKLRSQIAKTKVAGQDVILVKPETYMNDSGYAVVAVLNWFKLSITDLLVVHDDVSLNLGRLRFQSGGGAGGQHGVESIIEQFGGRKNFDRLKFGVGPDPGGDVRANYVLSRFPEVDRELFEKSLSTAREGLNSWIKYGINKTMNTFNGMLIGIPLSLQNDAKSGDGEKGNSKSQESKSPESKSLDSKPPDSKPSASKPPDPNPTDPKPTDSTASVSNSSDASCVQPTDSKSTKSNPKESSPGNTNSNGNTSADAGTTDNIRSDADEKQHPSDE